MRNSVGEEQGGGGNGFFPLPRRQRCSGGEAVLSLLLLSERTESAGGL